MEVFLLRISRLLMIRFWTGGWMVVGVGVGVDVDVGVGVFVAVGVGVGT